MGVFVGNQRRFAALVASCGLFLCLVHDLACQQAAGRPGHRHACISLLFVYGSIGHGGAGEIGGPGKLFRRHRGTLQVGAP